MQNNDVIVFEDVKPAAEYHFLVIPKEHIENDFRWLTDHSVLLKRIELFKIMKRAGEEVLNEHIVCKRRCITGILPSQSSSLPRTVDVPISPIQTMFGSHTSTYTTINHLHMYVVAPVDQMSKKSKDRMLGLGCKIWYPV